MMVTCRKSCKSCKRYKCNDVLIEAEWCLDCRHNETLEDNWEAKE